MIPKDCKRLAEVDFPIADVSRHASREKSIRHGHPSTLHLWWARRPLASSRAVLLGLLWPDPGDPLCPNAFKEKARELLPRVQGPPGEGHAALRKALLKFIADFANWDLAANRTYLDVSRALVKAAHGDEPPLVVDPFAGGGSIPLEALRVGCDAFASDLNPVACLILKVMLEDIPRHGPGLAEELRRVGAEIKRQAERELADLYPRDPDRATPIAYLWARTVRCESPRCGAEIPLVRSFWLCKKASRKRALCHRIVRPSGEPPHVEFEVFEPKSENAVPEGTVTRAKATCVCCNAVLPPERVRVQLAAQRGGADVAFDARGRRTGGARMLAVVTLRPGEVGRHYRLPVDRDYEAVWKAQARLAELLRKCEGGGTPGLCPVPDEAISLNEIRRISVPLYGMTRWSDLFAARQKAALVSLGRLVTQLPPSDGAVRTATAMVVSKLTDYASAQATWVSGGEFVRGTFGRQAIGMVWDWAEAVPWTSSSGNFDGALDWMAQVIESWPGSTTGQTQPADAAHHPLPDQTGLVWFTDPPYYDAVPYAHLSDFFYVWLRRTLPPTNAALDAIAAPKEAEIVVDRPHSLSRSAKDASSYEAGMARAFAEGRRVLREDGVACVVFAHKTTEGWEALLSGMIRAGWTITGSWPIATERGSRVNARDTASLATSIHLVCRPRPENASVGDWANVLRELPNRVANWMERLQGEGVRGADLVFACIGPALEIFSRYSWVETADGREVPLAEYLEKVWEVVGRSALAQVLGTAETRARNGAAGAVEEDARLTALFLWTLQSTNGLTADVNSEDAEGDDDEDSADVDEEDQGWGRGAAKGYTLVFDVVRRFAQPLGIDLPRWEGRVIETKKGVVRLLPVTERGKQLFGADGAQAVAARLEQQVTNGGHPLQGILFPEMRPAAEPVAGGRGRARGARAGVDASDESLRPGDTATTLDRAHAAMLLQASGRTNALRALLRAEQDRGPDFLRLANALSALYPKGSEEKRLLDAMLLAVPR
jgi:adenine-specific DNA methylase